MKLRAFRRKANAFAQRGFALIAILSLAALISAYLIANALAGFGSRTERDQRSMAALRKAETALIAYAASEQWQAYKGQTTDQPGGLPCPDNNDSGASPGICSSAASRVGRLPWASIGAEDLRDASGERLWYAVSSNFYKNAANIINSDTQGLLNVTGAAPANNVVAIVFAPGDALSGQDRIAQHNNPVAYLEGFTLTSPNYTFNSISTPSGTANDRQLVITQAELMGAIEPVVAARMAREVAPLLQDYYNKWGAYPFAVPFGSPPAAQSAYLGAAGQDKGLLSLTNTPPPFDWLSSPITVTQISGGTGSSTVTGTSCALNASPLRVVCQIDYSGGSGDRPAIRLQIPISNVHLAFADTPTSPNPGDLAMTDKDGDPIPPNAQPFGAWSQSTPTLEPTRVFEAQATRGAMIYTGRLRSASSTENRVFITVLLNAPPSLLPRLSDPSMAWFLLNQWYRQTYYAMSLGYAPGGGAACVTSGSPLCLTVNKLPSPNNDKRAILVLAGRVLNGTPRPSSNFANYLEGANLTAALGTTPFTYEHRAGTATSINDRVVIVSP